MQKREEAHLQLTWFVKLDVAGHSKHKSTIKGSYHSCLNRNRPLNWLEGESPNWTDLTKMGQESVHLNWFKSF